MASAPCVAVCLARVSVREMDEPYIDDLDAIISSDGLFQSFKCFQARQREVQILCLRFLVDCCSPSVFHALCNDLGIELEPVSAACVRACERFGPASAEELALACRAMTRDMCALIVASIHLRVTHRPAPTTRTPYWPARAVAGGSRPLQRPNGHSAALPGQPGADPGGRLQPGRHLYGARSMPRSRWCAAGTASASRAEPPRRQHAPLAR